MRNFDISEFACRCCGENHMDDLFLEKLDLARDMAGVPFIVNSGYRCPSHNKVVGSSSDNHPSGCAADIRAIDSGSRLLVLHGLLKAGFRRIGLHKSFIHADTMDTVGKPEACWFY